MKAAIRPLWRANQGHHSLASAVKLWASLWPRAHAFDQYSWNYNPIPSQNHKSGRWPSGVVGDFQLIYFLCSTVEDNQACLTRASKRRGGEFSVMRTLHHMLSKGLTSSRSPMNRYVATKRPNPRRYTTITDEKRHQSLVEGSSWDIVRYNL